MMVRRSYQSFLRCLLVTAFCCFWTLGCLWTLGSCSRATAQDSSLFHGVANEIPADGVGPADQFRGGSRAQSGQRTLPPRQQVAIPGNASSPYGYGTAPHEGLRNVNWTYTPPIPLRTFQKNDIVTIRVDELARVLAEGNAESRKITQFQAVLSDWIRLSKGRIKPDPQPDGDPSVNGQSNNQYRAESSLDSRESLTFSIAARVVDIRPNGNLVLEATESFRVNDNIWSTSLSGICRAQDVGPDNVVLSNDMLEMQINKQDQGHLRDGYKRGWFRRLLDQIKPF